MIDSKTWGDSHAAEILVEKLNRLGNKRLTRRIGTFMDHTFIGFKELGKFPVPPVVWLSVRYRTLIRMYKRKHAEARELKDYLVGLKNYLKGGWDEDEEYFYADQRASVPGHWVLNLIKEIVEMTEEGAVYTALPIKTGA